MDASDLFDGWYSDHAIIVRRLAHLAFFPVSVSQHLLYHILVGEGCACLKEKSEAKKAERYRYRN